MMKKKADRSFEWRLGEILVQKGWISWKQLEEALRVSDELKDGTIQAPILSGVISKTKKPSHLNLGEILIYQGSISWDQLADALRTQGKIGGALGQICLDRQYITEKQLYHALATQAGHTFVELKHVEITTEAVKLFTKEFVKLHKFMPIVKKRGDFLIAVSNFHKIDYEEAIKKIVPDHRIFIVVATPEDIELTIKRYYNNDS